MKRWFGVMLALAFATPLFAMKGVVFTTAGEPVAGATMEIFQPQSSDAAVEQVLSGKSATPVATAKTAADGAFAIDAKSDGTLVVVAKLDGYAPARVVVPAASDDVVLTLRRAELKTGSVRSAKGAVANATVVAIDHYNDVLATYTTDERGKFSIPDPKFWAAGICVR